jgi:hypothetical protein
MAMPDLAPKDHARLAQLVIAYHERFGGHVPARVLRLLDAASRVIEGSRFTGGFIFCSFCCVNVVSESQTPDPIDKYDVQPPFSL